MSDDVETRGATSAALLGNGISSTATPTTASNFSTSLIGRHLSQGEGQRSAPHRKPSLTLTRCSTSASEGASETRMIPPLEQGSIIPSDTPITSSIVEMGNSTSAEHVSPKVERTSLQPDKGGSTDALRELFHSDLQAIRAKLSCSICIKLLFEPYTLACGHTFCYSCLCQWFQNNKVKKTCPECRTIVTEQPAPAYLIKDLVQIFIEKAELMGPDETSEDNIKMRDEESEQVEIDKANRGRRKGGLFRGCFRNSTYQDVRAIRDSEDGVMRCPICNWELEDGCCSSCSLRFDQDGLYAEGMPLDSDFSDAEDDPMDEDSIEALDFDLDAELHALNEEEEENDALHSASHADDVIQGQGDGYPARQRHLPTPSIPSIPATSSELESDSEGDLGSLDGFIAQDESEEGDDDDDDDDEAEDDEVEASSDRYRASSDTGVTTTTSTSIHRNTRSRWTPVPEHPSETLSSENSENSDEGGAISNGRRPRQANTPPRRRPGDTQRAHSSVTPSADPTWDREVEDAELLRSAWSGFHRGVSGQPDTVAPRYPHIAQDRTRALPRNAYEVPHSPRDPQSAVRTGRIARGAQRHTRQRAGTILTDESEADENTSAHEGISFDDDGDCQMEGGGRDRSLGQNSPRESQRTVAAGSVQTNSDSSEDAPIRRPLRRRQRREHQ